LLHEWRSNLIVVLHFKSLYGFEQENFSLLTIALGFKEMIYHCWGKHYFKKLSFYDKELRLSLDFLLRNQNGGLFQRTHQTFAVRGRVDANARCKKLEQEGGGRLRQCRHFVNRWG